MNIQKERQQYAGTVAGFFACILLAAALLLPATRAQAFDDRQFQTLVDQIGEEKFEPVEKFLEANRKRLEKDPNYYVILLNYVSYRGDESGMMVAQGEPQPGDLTLTDPDSGEVKGFIRYQTRFNEPLIVDGIHRTQAAMHYFPTRLDIHFGIVSIAQKIGRWDIVGDELVSMLKSSGEIDNRWTWGPIGSMQGDPKEFMIQNTLPRTSAMFRKGTAMTDAALIRVSQALIDYYPDIIYGYANLGALYLAKKDYAKAEKYLLKASEIDPNDEIVQGNLKTLRKQRH